MIKIRDMALSPWQRAWASSRLQGSFFDNLAKIEESTTTRLGQRKFDGRTLVGFALPRDNFVKRDHMLCNIWVNPQSRLPVV